MKRLVSLFLSLVVAGGSYSRQALASEPSASLTRSESRLLFAWDAIVAPLTFQHRSLLLIPALLRLTHRAPGSGNQRMASYRSSVPDDWPEALGLQRSGFSPTLYASLQRIDHEVIRHLAKVKIHPPASPSTLEDCVDLQGLRTLQNLLDSSGSASQDAAEAALKRYATEIYPHRGDANAILAWLARCDHATPKQVFMRHAVQFGTQIPLETWAVLAPKSNRLFWNFFTARAGDELGSTVTFQDADHHWHRLSAIPSESEGFDLLLALAHEAGHWGQRPEASALSARRPFYRLIFEGYQLRNEYRAIRSVLPYAPVQAAVVEMFLRLQKDRDPLGLGDQLIKVLTESDHPYEAAQLLVSAMVSKVSLGALERFFVGGDPYELIEALGAPVWTGLETFFTDWIFTERRFLETACAVAVRCFLESSPNNDRAHAVPGELLGDLAAIRSWSPTSDRAFMEGVRIERFFEYLDWVKAADRSPAERRRRLTFTWRPLDDSTRALNAVYEWFPDVSRAALLGRAPLRAPQRLAFRTHGALALFPPSEPILRPFDWGAYIEALTTREWANASNDTRLDFNRRLPSVMADVEALHVEHPELQIPPDRSDVETKFAFQTAVLRHSLDPVSGITVAMGPRSIFIPTDHLQTVQDVLHLLPTELRHQLFPGDTLRRVSRIRLDRADGITDLEPASALAAPLSGCHQIFLMARPDPDSPEGAIKVRPDAPDGFPFGHFGVLRSGLLLAIVMMAVHPAFPPFGGVFKSAAHTFGAGLHRQNLELTAV